MRSAFAGLSLPTIWNTMASVTSIASYFAYSFTSHIRAFYRRRLPASHGRSLRSEGVENRRWFHTTFSWNCTLLITQTDHAADRKSRILSRFSSIAVSRR